MPRVEHLYPKRSRHYLSFLVLAVLIVISSISSVWLFTPKNAAALGQRGPDKNDFSVENSSGAETSTHSNIGFEMDNSTYVYTPSTYFRVYYPNRTGNNLTFYSTGLMDAEEYKGGSDGFDQVYGTPALPKSEDLAEYNIYDSNGDQLGTYTAQVGSTTHTMNFSFPTTQGISTATNTYTLRVFAHILAPVPNRIHDGFYVNTTNAGAIVGLDSSSAVTAFGMQEWINPMHYSTWHLKFAPDCGVVPPSGETASFTWYDADNGNSGVQPEKMSFRIYDYTDPANPVPIKLSNPQGSDFTSSNPGHLSGPGYTVTPGGGSKDTGSIDFMAYGGHKYQVVWSHVYSNNTLQFKLPYDSIFYAKPCQNYPGLKATIAGPALPYLVAGQGYDFSAGAKNTSATTTKGYDETAATDSPTYAALTNTSWTGLPGVLPSKSVTQTPLMHADISANTPDGSTVCFTTTVSPANPDGSSNTSEKLCYPVYKVYTPAIQGLGSDIHAGGGVCGGTQYDGSLIGNSDAISYGQYVVSASSGVSYVGSNKSTADSSATLGGYLKICRPDLVTKAAQYITAHPSTPTISGSVSMATLAAKAATNPDGVVYAPSGLTITGGAVGSKKMTLYSPGQVTITGNITGSVGNFAAASQPSLGIIANTIYVQPIAPTTNMTVNAYMFAGGTFNSCANKGWTYCTNTLTVNGFVMANTLSLNRTGPQPPTGTTQTVGELMIMTPQLYVNPPKIFDNLTELNLVQSQGERPPLY